MHILVVGATGFLGAHTYNILKNTSDLSVSGTYGRQALFRELHHVDLTSRSSVRALMNETNPDVVVWCAKHTSAELSEGEINDIGLREILKSGKPRMRLVFVSTDGMLPGIEGNYAENSVTGPIESDSNIARYTNSKLQTEKYIASATENYCIVRVGPIYGRNVSGKWDHRISELAKSFARNETVSRATNIRRSFIQVEDLAMALGELALNSYQGTIHLGPRDSASYFDFARSAARAFGFPSELAQPYVVSDEDITANAIKVDTSLDTRLAENVLNVRFSSLASGMLKSHTTELV